MIGSKESDGYVAGNRSSLAAPSRLRPSKPRPAVDAPAIPLMTEREGLCVECGLPEGRRHKCPAHPRPPGMHVMVFAFFLCPLILVPVVGWNALLGFAPWFVFAWWVKTR
jgi:hypothetical protein